MIYYLINLVIIVHIQKAKLFHDAVDADKNSHCLNVRLEKLPTGLSGWCNYYQVSSKISAAVFLGTCYSKFGEKTFSENVFRVWIWLTNIIYLVAPGQTHSSTSQNPLFC